jgi:hypothetical protein
VAPCTLALLLGLVLLQRLALPLGGTQQLPLMVPLGTALLAVGLYRGEFRLAHTRVRILALVIATAVICSLAQVVVGNLPSVLSLGLLVALYAILALDANLTPGAVTRIERVYLRVMTVFAIVSLGQMLVQLAGVPYEDYLLRLVPDTFLLTGFNTGDPIAYGDALYRSNGVVFLEPSFISMFLGLAVALAVYRRASALTVTVLLVGMIPPLAGSGFVVLVPALIALALTRRRRRHLLAVVPALLIAVVVATLTPLGDRYVQRTTEASQSNTSASFRLIEPYTALLPVSLEDAPHAAFGHGAGSADDFFIEAGRGDATQPIIPKILFEYGLVGVVGILLPLLVVFAGSLRSRPWTVGLVLLFVFVNASFLQAVLVLFTFFWMTLMPYGRRSDSPGSGAATDTRRLGPMVPATGVTR